VGEERDRHRAGIQLAGFAARSLETSSRHRHGCDGRHFLRHGLAEDFQKQCTDVEVTLALGTAAQASIGRVANQVFELFSHDIVFIGRF
jgi:hypothetical protein